MNRPRSGRRRRETGGIPEKTSKMKMVIECHRWVLLLFAAVTPVAYVVVVVVVVVVFFMTLAGWRHKIDGVHKAYA